jgi:hypothetical protein
MGLRTGDKVGWQSPGYRVRVTVEEKITSRRPAAGRTVDASPDEPRYRGRSDRTGRDAVHTEEALRRE